MLFALKIPFQTLELMILTAVIVGILVYSYTKLFHYHEGSIWNWMILCCQGKYSQEEKKIGFSAYLDQFSCSLKGPIAAHVLIGVFLYFSMLIMTSYQAKLKSFLTLSHARGTDFTDMDGMIDAVYYKVDIFLVLEKFIGISNNSSTGWIYSICLL